MRHGETQRRGLLLAALILLASGWLAAFGVTLWRLHDKAVSDGFAAARMYARHFEDSLTKTLQVIDLSVGNLPPHLTLGDADAPASTAHLHSLLRPSPFLRSLSILTLDGRVLASSDARNRSLQIDLSGFYPAAALGGAPPRLGQPWIGRELVTAQPSRGEALPPRASSLVPFMRRFTLNGQAYWWLAALNPDDFIQHFAQLLPPEQGRVQLLRYDGVLLLSSSAEDSPGRRDQSGAVAALLAQHEIGELAQTLPDAQRVLTAYRTSSQYPAVIAVHLNRGYLQQQWLDEVLQLSMIVVPILIALSITILRLWLRRQRLEQQRAELERQRQLVSSVFEASSDAIMLTTPSGEILSTNPAFERITGYSDAEARGRNPRFLASGLHGQTFYRELWDTVITRGHWRGEITNRRRTGDLYTGLLTIDVVRDERGLVQHYVGVTSDITERKQHEAELLAAKERAETAARAKTTFLSTMSHELRTPMHGILGMTEILLESELSERQRRQLDTVKRSAGNLLAILADILDYTRLDSEELQLQPVPFDPLQRLEQLAASFQAQADSKGLGLRVDQHRTPLEPVIGDVQAIQQILHKLIANALKFTHEGEIVLHVDLISEGAQSGTLCVEVRDTGIGIDSSLHEAIFEPFIQADGSHTRRYGGTGLGLTIARRLAEALGGQLTVTSVPAQGSCFRLQVPVQRALSQSNVTA